MSWKRLIYFAFLIPIFAAVADPPGKTNYWTDYSFSKKYYAPEAGERLLSFELELTAQPLSRLMKFFDTGHEQFKEGFERLKASGLEKELIVEKYLMSPGAVAALPEEVRAELTRGLDITIPKIDVALPKDLPGKILHSSNPQQGIIHEARNPIIARDGEGRILQPKTAAKLDPKYQHLATSTSNSGLAVDRQTAWKILDDRWNSLPVEKRLALVQFEHLDPLKQAFFVIQHDISFNTEALREGAPKYLRNMKWHKELDAVEFKLKNPVASHQELNEVLQDLAIKTGITEQLNHPERPPPLDRFKSGSLEEKIGSKLFTYHLHYSREYLNTRVFNKYRYWHALKLYQQDRTALIFPNEAYTFSFDAAAKGTARSIEVWHKEIRHHYADPLTEIKDLDSFTQADPGKAIKKLDQEMQKMMTHDFIRRLYEKNNKGFLEVAAPLLPMNEKHWGQLISDQKTIIKMAELKSKIHTLYPNLKLSWNSVLSLKSKTEALPMLVELLQNEILTYQQAKSEIKLFNSNEFKKFVNLLQNESRLPVSKYDQAIRKSVKALLQGDAAKLTDGEYDLINKCGRLNAIDAYSPTNIDKTTALFAEDNDYKKFYSKLFDHWNEIPENSALKKKAYNFIDDRGWGLNDPEKIKAFSPSEYRTAKSSELLPILTNPKDPSHAMIMKSIADPKRLQQWGNHLRGVIRQEKIPQIIQDPKNPLREVLGPLLALDEFGPQEELHNLLIPYLHSDDPRIKKAVETLVSGETFKYTSNRLKWEILKDPKNLGYDALIQTAKERFKANSYSLIYFHESKQVMNAFEANPRLHQDLGEGLTDEVAKKLKADETFALRKLVQSREGTCQSAFFDVVKAIGHQPSR